MCLRTSPSEYKFIAHLREGLSPEMVTVYAKRRCRLAIVVDAWHLEQDSHHEWEIAFTPQDVDMASIRAHLESDGQLNVTVQRRREADPENISPPMFL
ncbi:hypothetical protein WOLCODRAFT_85445 [Wolfiporia cocos MD-104 SS10]|uniref:SHSP domain-containing protein n=1 Tax=Wolfiporia cocos (strain MD-104) TaxID=742152 RepID=A0A2H3JBR1_WOLCO|nr:hypothetical protein WOLCODRAFT_85445 [Wolfiporia cocos MD-104 SS10]